MTSHYLPKKETFFNLHAQSLHQDAAATTTGIPGLACANKTRQLAVSRRLQAAEEIIIGIPEVVPASLTRPPVRHPPEDAVRVQRGIHLHVRAEHAKCHPVGAVQGIGIREHAAAELPQPVLSLFQVAAATTTGIHLPVCVRLTSLQLQPPARLLPGDAEITIIGTA